LKRNWKLDNTVPDGTYVYWHGEPNRLPAPWVHRCFDIHPWNSSVKNRCPSAYQNKKGHYTDLCVIQKLDNLMYLEYKLELKEKYERHIEESKKAL
jgi:hypothetical protein